MTDSAGIYKWAWGRASANFRKIWVCNSLHLHCKIQPRFFWGVKHWQGKHCSCK